MQTETSATTESLLAHIPPATSSVRRASFYQDKGEVRPGGLLVPYPRCLQLVVHGLKRLNHFGLSASATEERWTCFSPAGRMNG
jgi:hypothetical protein